MAMTVTKEDLEAGAMLSILEELKGIQFSVGDKVRATSEMDNGIIAVGDIGVVKLIRKGTPWPYYVDFGKGGITDFEGLDDRSVIGLAPTCSLEIEKVS